ncbi:MAG TPA: VCBS domain-containing protein, partial [Pseudomonadales bacterium]|nr:VCBS domain-containing protein [Pseudomonadales bacterium]
AAVDASGDVTGLVIDNAILRAMLSVNIGDVITNSETTGTLSWVFDSASEAFDYLAVDETLTLTYTVRVTDSFGDSSDKTVEITVTGTNDLPALTVPATTDFVEALDASAQVLSQSGTVSFSDLDTTDTVSITFTSDQNVTWSGGVLDAALSNKIIAGLSLSATNVSATGSANWQYAISADNFDFLLAEETITFSYTVVMTESQGEQRAETLLFTLRGTNDGPELQAINAVTITDTAINDTFAVIDGKLVASDVDRNDSQHFSMAGQFATTLRSGFDLASEGSFGTVYLNSQTGAYHFEPNNSAINGLQNDTTETFTFTVTDGSASTATRALLINLVAANDTPDISASLSSTTYIETTLDDTFAPVSGTLSGSDRDVGATALYSITGGVASNALAGFDQRYVGTYGTLYLNSVSGAYAYLPNDAAIEGLSAGSIQKDSFIFSRTDGLATADTAFVVWVVGASDTPIIAEGGDQSTLHESDTSLAMSGTLTVVDNDINDSVNMSVSSVAVSGSSTGTHPANADLLAMLTLTPSALLDDANAISASVTWSFDSDTEAFDYLAKGETLILTYSLVAEDTGSPSLLANDTVEITIVGTNDGPQLLTPARRQIIETANDDVLAVLNGSFNSTDKDHNAEVTYRVAGDQADESLSGFDYKVEGEYGALWLNSSTGAYRYVPSESAIEALKEPQAEQFSVRVSDGIASQTKSLWIDIEAVNDTPVLEASVTSATLVDTAVNDTFTSNIEGTLSSSDRDGDAVTFQIAGQTADVNVINGVRYDSVKTHALGHLYLNSSTGNYTFVANQQAVNALTNDASIVFTMLGSDGDASANQTLTINVTAANDTPQLEAIDAIALTDTAGNDAFSGVAGSLISADRDAQDTATYSVASQVTNTSRSGFDVSTTGTYGTLFLNTETGAWFFSPNDTAINSLTSDGSEAFEFTVTDAQGATAMQSLTVNLVAANDTPVVTASLIETTYIETSTTDTFAAVTGQLTGTDRDSGDTVAFNVTSGVAEANTVASVDYDTVLAGDYGTLYLASVSGAYTYVPDNDAINGLNAGETKFDSFNLLGTDGTDSSNTIFLVTLVGATDAPAIAEGGDIVDVSETNAVLSLSGQMIVIDDDLNDSVDITIPSVELTADSDIDHPANDELLAMLTVTPANPLLGDASSINTQITWQFNSDPSTFDYLDEGETIVLTYKLLATDSGSSVDTQATPLTVEDSVTIKITGTNDGPVLEALNSITLNDSSSEDIFETQDGRLVATDVDHNAALTFTIAGGIADTTRVGFDISRSSSYGTLYLNASTGDYQFVPDQNAVNALLVDVDTSFTLIVNDGIAQAAQTLSINIVASNDTPELAATVISANYVDTTSKDAFAQTIVGELSSMDRDANDTVLYGVDGGQSDTSRPGFDTKVVDTYGSLFLNSQTGVYEFIPDAEAMNAVLTNVSTSFTFFVEDSAGAQDSVDFTVNIVGANDVPEISVTGSDSDQVLLTESTSSLGLVATGTLTASDRDTSQTASVQVISLAKEGAVEGLSSNDTQLLNMLSVNTGNVIEASANSGVIQWAFDSATESFDYLADGQTLTLRYSIRLIDSDGLSADRDLLVSIVGTNDAPTISAQIMKEFTEAYDASAQQLLATGNVTFNDVDRSDVIDISFASNNDIVWTGGTINSELAA